MFVINCFLLFLFFSLLVRYHMMVTLLIFRTLISIVKLLLSFELHTEFYEYENVISVCF